MSSSGVRPWFRPNRSGIGMTPATWQGWLALLVFVVLLVGTTLLADPDTLRPRNATAFIQTRTALGLTAIHLPRAALFGILAAEVASFFLFCRWMGAPARPLD
jgi:hypothetical protein